MLRVLVEPPAWVVDDESRRRARLVAALLLVVLAATATAAPIEWWLVPGFRETAVVIVPAFAVMLVGYVLSRTRHYRVGAIIVSMVPTMAALGVTAVHPEDPYGARFAFVGVLLAGFLLSARWAVGLSLFVFLGFAWLVAAGLDPPLAQLVPALSLNLVCCVLVIVGVRHRDALERDRRAVLAAAQEQLRRQDRLAAIGTLSAAIAHELSSPLTALSLQVGTLGGGNAPATLSPEALRDLREAIERMSAIVQGLRTTARDDSGAATGFADVAEAVRAATVLVGAELRSRAQLEVDVAADLPLVRGHRVRLGQVFLNLLVNAAHALPRHGDASAQVVRVVARRRQDFVEVAVTDSGEGIAPEALPHLFEPFYTTKPAGAGTGLGLWVCKGIVDELGGRIEVDSAPGKGSTFRVLLPVAPPEAQYPHNPRSTAA